MNAEKVGFRFVAHFGLWPGTAYGIATLALYDGSGYFWKGNSVAKGDSFAVLRSLPYGMRLHGFCLLVFSILIFVTASRRNSRSTWIMFGMFFYSLSIGAAIVVGTIQARNLVWSAPSKWFFVAWMSLLLFMKGYILDQRAQLRSVRENNDR